MGKQKKYGIKVPNGIRSKNSDVKSLINFKNLTNAVVTLYWINLEGQAKVFAKLKPVNRCDKGFCVESYRTHPWVAIQNDRTMVLLNEKRYFHPPLMNQWKGKVNGHLSNKWNLSSEDHVNIDANFKEILILNAGNMHVTITEFDLPKLQVWPKRYPS